MSNTTIVLAGQPSDAVLAKLKDAGAQLTDEQIEALFDRAERARVSFVCQAIAAGVLLLAKKQSLRHGQWLPWCERFGSTYAAKLVARCQSRPTLSGRSLREYAYLAQHFIADLEQGTFRPESRDLPAGRPEVTTEQVLAIDMLDSSQQELVWRRIEGFVAGRSIRTMISDLRRAESAADQEEEAASAARAKRAKGTRSDPDQYDFWDELNRPLTELSTLMQSPDFVERTTREAWLKLASELTAKAKQAREMAEKIR